MAALHRSSLVPVHRGWQVASKSKGGADPGAPPSMASDPCTTSPGNSPILCFRKEPRGKHPAAYIVYIEKGTDHKYEGEKVNPTKGNFLPRPERLRNSR